MTGTLLSIILDVLVMGFLGVTTYYAIKLTQSLNAFRETRQEFNSIMRELSRNIDEAQRGVEALKNASRESGAALQKIINESRSVAVELQGMNQGRPRAPVAPARAEDVDSLEAFHRLEQEMLEELAREEEAELTEGFAIFDREYEQADDEEGNEAPAGFRSKAEQELFDALQKTRRTRGAA